MTEQHANLPTSLSPTRRFLPLLLLLFFGSGCAALIYEIVWLQLLQLVVGSSAVSLGVLLGTFMGGMCLGSLTLAPIVSARRHPLRVYALLELGIGVLGIAALFVVPYVARLYVAGAAQWVAGGFFSGAAGGGMLLFPPLLRGPRATTTSRPRAGQRAGG